MRDEISVKNQYYISKFRRLELKYFCKQYPVWEKAYNSLASLDSRPDDLNKFNAYIKSSLHADPVAKRATALAEFSKKMDLVRKAAIETDKDLAEYIIVSVTQGKPYEWLYVNMNIPCCRDTYFMKCRKFFWLLNKYRD